MPRSKTINVASTRSKGNATNKRLQREVYVEMNRYGSKQNLDGKIVKTNDYIDPTLARPNEIKKLENTLPYASIIDGSTVDSHRRKKAIYHQYDNMMLNERKKLQYILDILPKNAKLHPAQPKAPQNRYFKKT